jgi:hypothetical protein
MEIRMDGKDAENKEEGEGDPGGPCNLLHPHEEGPKSKKADEDEEVLLKREEKVEMA